MSAELTPKAGRELPRISVTRIPPLPQATLHILSVARKPNVSAAEVAKALGTDPSIALRFLSIANSAVFSGTTRISTLPHCVAWLGLEFVKGTVVTLGVGGVGLNKANPYLNPTLAWRHNMSVAACCEMICNHVTGWQPGEAYTTGLTHDVGKQIMLLTRRDQYERCLARAADEQRDLYLVENQVIGMDHALVGALALREWKLSPELVQVVLKHHEANLDAEHGKMVAVLQLAHQICQRVGYGTLRGARPNTSRLPQDRLGLDSAVIDGIVGDLKQHTKSFDDIIKAVTDQAA